VGNKRELQRRSQPRNANNVQLAGHAGQPAIQPTDPRRLSSSDPLLAKEHAAAVAALLTALGGLLAWLISVGVHLDSRLDRLEQATRILLAPDGTILPAKETLETKYHAQALEREIAVMRDRLKQLETRTLQK
jgi:hypothetical protein